MITNDRGERLFTWSLRVTGLASGFSTAEYLTTGEAWARRPADVLKKELAKRGLAYWKITHDTDDMAWATADPSGRTANHLCVEVVKYREGER